MIKRCRINHHKNEIWNYITYYTKIQNPFFVRNIFKVKDWNKNIFVNVLKAQLIERLFSENSMLFFLPDIFQHWQAINSLLFLFPCVLQSYYLSVISSPLCASKTTTQVPQPILNYHTLMHVVKWIPWSSNLRLSFTYALGGITSRKTLLRIRQLLKHECTWQ